MSAIGTGARSRRKPQLLRIKPATIGDLIREVESMLAAQMAGVHMATMTFVRRLARTEIISEADSAERVLNKLARTFTTQVEGLKRYRTGGEQRVTVEHVHVHSGGQAIVGSVAPVTKGGGKVVGVIKKMENNLMDRLIRQPLPLRTAPWCGRRPEREVNA